ncbi:VanZ family protein [Agromyces laixinhei]|uniref:VanZ family protein n=1 Tax=Agromyces laixinhei TaxID=2585717 RepID=UPI001116FD12|nr:VanZ family protein [Agromyces laixinhei]
MNRRPLGIVAAAYAGAVLWVTIGPAPWRTAGYQLDGGILNPEAWVSPLTWTTGYITEIAFNVAIFVPVGVLAALLISRRLWPLAMLAGLGFTTLIELVQLPEPTRVSDPRDLVMNAAGAVLGVLIVVFAREVRRAGLVAASLADPTSAALADPTSASLPDPTSASLPGTVADGAPTPEPTPTPALTTAHVDKAA